MYPFMRVLLQTDSCARGEGIQADDFSPLTVNPSVAYGVLVPTRRFMNEGIFGMPLSGLVDLLVQHNKISADNDIDIIQRCHTFREYVELRKLGEGKIPDKCDSCK